MSRAIAEALIAAEGETEHQRVLKLALRKRQDDALKELNERIKELEADLALEHDLVVDLQGQLQEAQSAGKHTEETAAAERASFAGIRDEIVKLSEAVAQAMGKEMPGVNLTPTMVALSDLSSKLDAVMAQAKLAATRSISTQSEPVGEVDVIVHRNELGRVTKMVMKKRS